MIDDNARRILLTYIAYCNDLFVKLLEDGPPDYEFGEHVQPHWGCAFHDVVNECRSESYRVGNDLDDLYDDA